MTELDAAWIRANPEAAAELIDQLQHERDRAVARAAAAEADNAALRSEAPAHLVRPPDVLARIEAHLRATGMSPSTFGEQATGDPRLVPQLRAGRSLRPKTEARIRAFLVRNARAGSVRPTWQRVCAADIGRGWPANLEHFHRAGFADSTLLPR